MAYGRGIEKFDLAVRWLASSPDDIQSRVKMALRELTLLQAGDIPEGALRHRWQSITDRIGHKPVTSQGQITTLVRALSEDEASELAREIVDIMWLLHEVDAGHL